ncbi:MAG TPA: TIGR00374 family protein, partial [Candidatus Competibacter phosphatis]|nr:TIGR00374 family protein [Candidatus Competibacter phosphatis]
GSTEAVMGMLLITFGADSAAAVAITLLCRIATLWFAVVLGGLAVAVLSLRGQRPASECKP